MTNSLTSKARMGRVIALNTLTARKNKHASKVVELGAHAPVMFKNVEHASFGRPNRPEVFAECGLTCISGYVTWYSAEQGWGEFMCEKTNTVVQFTSAVIHGFGVQTVVEGTWIEAQCMRTTQGYRANDLLGLLPPENWFAGNGYATPPLAA